MISFRVTREEHGWAVRIGVHMMTPFWSKQKAIGRANDLAGAIRAHGQLTEVVVEPGL
jgi:hypothetical protein